MRSPRGFTLMEMAVTLGVAGLAISAMLGIFISQQAAMAAQENVRQMQDHGRTAAGLVERALRRAGFGVDPAIAFDFDAYPALPCTTPPCARDRVDAPDRVVFYARNPRYSITGPMAGRMWTYNGGGSSVMLAARTGDRFLRGQILGIMCDGAAEVTYVTVNATSEATADGEVTLPLAAPPQADGSPANRFHRQDLLTTAPCFAVGAGTTTIAFAVDRFHFFVHEYADENGQPTTWLMLDTGRDENSDGQITALDWLPVAEGVEDLQFEYRMNFSPTATAPDEDADWIYANTPGVQEIPDLLTAPPRYSDSSRSAMRHTGHPGNIRAVRFHLVVRGRSVGEPGAPGDPAEALGNRTVDSLPEPDEFKRLTVSATVGTPNLMSRARFRL